MARQKKAQTTEEQIEKMKAIVLQRKAAYDEAVASSKWSYEKIMSFIQSDPEDADE